MDDKRRLYQQLRLKNGRILSYAEYGPPEGTAVIYCHGFPSSRLDWQLCNDNDILRALNVRIIAPDRPGYGRSDFTRLLSIADWPQDVAALADALAIEKFAVLGISGGGPYAAACGYILGDCVTKVGIVCGMGTPDAPGMKDGISWSIPNMPALVRNIILRLMALGLRRDPNQFIAKTKEAVSDIDRQLLDKPGVADLFIAGMREAFYQGIGGANLDAGLYGRNWGFDLADISTQVHLWHGKRDKNVPISVGRYVADAIPNCQATFLENEGHFTLPYGHLHEILSGLMAAD